MNSLRIVNPSVIMKKLPISGFEVYVHATPGDGNCILHAVANAIYLPYRTQTRDGTALSKAIIVNQMRQEMLAKLNSINPKSGKTNYETIAGGALAESAEWNEKSSLQYLKELLSSSGQLGEEAKIVLEFFIEKNLLVINASTKKLAYRYDWDANRSSIILYYTALVDGEGNESGHYEMISVRNSRLDILETHFSKSHPFVRYLLENI
jgi:hypothetical protein